MTDTHLGLIVTAVPALIIGLILLSRYKPVLWMYIGAVAIGLGYLTVQGTVEDIGKETRTYLPAEKAAEPLVAPAPAPAVAPEPVPTPPAPVPAPSPSPAPETAPQPSPAPAPETPAETSPSP
ncbi:MAG TPA: hypothetical protein PLW75_14095 [Hyphomicrobium sp.]|nr:hypothetical protein [Hyphomicrobium sp.]